MEDVYNYIGRLLAEKNLLAEYEIRRILRNWEDIVGPALASYTEFHEFKKGTLVIRANNSPAMQEIVMRKFMLIQSLNEKIGANVVKDIKCTSKSGKNRHMYENNYKKEFEKELLAQPKESISLFGEDASDFIPSRYIRLDEQTVAEIDALVEAIPEEVMTRTERDLIRQSSIQRKKKEFYLQQKGFRKCSHCGAYIEPAAKTCFYCDQKYYLAKLAALRKLIFAMPYIKYEEIQHYERSTMNQVTQARQMCIQKYLDCVRQAEPTLEDRFQLAMLITQKRREELGKQYVIEFTEKFRKFVPKLNTGGNNG